jgi:hypothetical protein
MFEHGLVSNARNNSAMVQATAIKPANIAVTLTNNNTQNQQPLKK